MSDDIEIRVGTASDTAALVEFNCEMAWETESRELHVPTVTAGVSELFDRPERGFYVVALQSGEIVGSLMITTEWSDWRNGDFWWVQSVYVRPRARRQGIYRQLYRFVQQRARDTGGVCGFRLYVERDNAPAQKTYEALGMQVAVYRMYEAALAEQERA